MTPSTTAPPPAALPRVHARRLRQMYRSAGWPVRDAVEIDLLAAGLLERVDDGCGHETLRVTDAGLQVLARSLQRNRAAFDLHEALVERVVREMQHAGRIAWSTLALRTRVDGRWQVAQPDVYSLRHTTVESYLEPLVHEVKVRRADLLADLRRPTKRAAYLQMAGACCYVLAEGIADPDEVPPECGVWIARRLPSAGDGQGFGALDCVRPPPRQRLAMPFAVWMALARATPAGLPLDDPQAALGAEASAAIDALAAPPASAHDAPAGNAPHGAGGGTV